MRSTYDSLPDWLSATILGHGGRLTLLHRVLRPVETASQRFAYAARAAAFWTGIVLPAVHAPLVFTGVDGPYQFGFLLGLLVANVLALLFGHRHHSGTET